MSDKIVQFNEEVIKEQPKELVRGSVEETLNELLEKEATKCNNIPDRMLSLPETNSVSIPAVPPIHILSANSGCTNHETSGFSPENLELDMKTLLSRRRGTIIR